MARRGHGCAGHRRLRRPRRREDHLRGLVHGVVGPAGVGARDPARGSAGGRFGDVLRRPHASDPHVPRPTVGQGHVPARGKPAIRACSQHHPDSLQLRAHGPTGRRRRPDHQGGPVGRRPAPAAAQGRGGDDDHGRRGGWPGARGRSGLVPAFHRRVRLRRASARRGGGAAPGGRRLPPSDDLGPPSAAGGDQLDDRARGAQVRLRAGRLRARGPGGPPGRACAAHRGAARPLAGQQRPPAAEPQLRRPPVATGPQGRGDRGLHPARPPALLRQRSHRLWLRRGDRAAGARTLLGDDHARRLLPPVAHGRGPHARRSGRPDGRRAGRDVRTSADRETWTGR